MGKGASFLAGILAIPVLAGATVVAVPKWREYAADWIAKHSNVYQEVVDSNKELTEENEQLRDERDAKQTALANVTAELAAARTSLADVNARLTTANENLAAERTAKAELQTRVNELLAEKAELEQRIAQLIEHGEEVEPIIDELRLNVENLTAQIEEKDSIIATLNTQITSLNTQIEEYRNQIATLSGQLEDLEKTQGFQYGRYVASYKNDDGKYEDIHIEVMDNGKVKLFSNSFTVYSTGEYEFYINENDFKLFDYTQNGDKIIVDFTGYAYFVSNPLVEFVITSNKSFEATDEEIGLNFVYCDETLEEALLSRQELQSELNATKNNRESLQNEVQNLTSQLESLNSQLNEIVSERDNLQSQLSQSTTTIVTLQAQIAEKDASIENLTTQVNSLQAQAVILNNTIAQLSAELEEIHTQIEDLQSQLDEYEQYTINIDQTNAVESIVIFDSKLNTIAPLQDETITQLKLYSWQTATIKYVQDNDKNIMATLNGEDVGADSVTISGDAKEVFTVSSFDENLRAFKLAVQAGGDITLQNNVVLDSTVDILTDTNIDFNEHTIYGANVNGAALKVLSGATLTLDGTGGIVGGRGADCRAVEVAGQLDIYNGNYSVGPDTDGYGNSTIYLTANGAKLNIYGGYFDSEAAWNNFYYVINLNNSITAEVNVYGGTFVKYNPALGDDHLGGNFVADGYEVVEDGDNFVVQQIQVVENNALSARYFNIKDGVIYGLSSLGVEKYENGELTELNIPSSYSIGSIVERSFEVNLTNLSDFFEADPEKFNFVYDGVEYTLTDWGDDVSQLFNTLIYEQEETVLCSWEELEYIDGDDILITEIYPNAFYGRDNLNTIFIPNTIVAIGSNAFACINLTAINVADSNEILKDIDGVLYTKDGQTIVIYPNAKSSSYTIPDGVTTIGDGAFMGCSSLANITIPESVTTIGDGAFMDCSSLANITIPESVTTIGDGAFKDCSSLANITIPESVTTIGEYAFAGCSALALLTIPSSVSNIGTFAFIGTYCDYVIEATTPPTIGNNLFKDTGIYSRYIYVPAESVEAYKTADGWSEYADRIQAITA